MTIPWKAVKKCFTVMLFVFQIYTLCRFGKFINFGIGTVRNERLESLLNGPRVGRMDIIVVKSSISSPTNRTVLHSAIVLQRINVMEKQDVAPARVFRKTARDNSTDGQQ